MIINKNFFLCSLLTVLGSCNFLSVKDSGTVENHTRSLARVNDTYLLYSQLPSYLKAYSGKDSAAAVNNYSQEWIKKQLLVEAATETIIEDEEISRKVENYRQYLLVEEFKKKYIDKHLDSAISAEEVKAYYEQHPILLKNNEEIAKGHFIQVPLNVPGIKSVKELLGKKDQTEEIHSFCIRYAKNFHVNTWFSLNEALQGSAFKLEEKEKLFEKGRLYEQSDAEFTYLVYIAEKRKPGEIAPLEFVEPYLKNLIVNDKKLKIIEKLEEEIYNEGKKTGKIEVF